MHSQLDYFLHLNSALLLRTAEQLALYQHRVRSRRALAKLNDEQLRDIGISRTEALKESNTPFWKGDGRSFIKSRRKHHLKQEKIITPF